MTIFYLIIFIVSFFGLALSSRWLINALIKIAKFLKWKEFVVAFFTMALVGASPNLSVGLSSVFHKVPQLSFSEIVGGNIVDLTIAVALAAFVSRNGLALVSRTVQGSAIFTLFIAIAPILLIFDGQLSRMDGVLLILAFVVYVNWLFGRKERFSKPYNKVKEALTFKIVFKNVMKILLAVLLLILAAEGIVRSVSFFSNMMNLPISLIGILIVGLGNAMPEIFFSIHAARRGNDWIVVGNLMGSVIAPVTLVLGTVAILSPIEISRFAPFAIGRFFLVISAVFFLLFLRTDKKITKKEGIFLLLIYLSFVLAEILFV